MNNEDLVKAEYPEAGAVMLNRGLYYIAIDGARKSKLGAGEKLSGLFKKQQDAWADAASRIRSVK